MHSIHSFKQLLTKKYDPTWKNIQIVLLNTPPGTHFSQPMSQATFNLAISTTGLPLGTLSLLALGLKFCLKASHPTHKINHSIIRFETNVGTKYLMINQEDSHKFIPQLYIRNPSWDPLKASAQIETALAHFRHSLIAEQSKFNKCSRPNISCLQKTALHLLSHNKKFIIIWADKNWDQ